VPSDGEDKCFAGPKLRNRQQPFRSSETNRRWLWAG